MLLTIVRHAIAVQRGTGDYPNDDRPLTPKGIRRMKLAAAGFEAILECPDLIFTSPLSRAAETARIIADALHEPGIVRTSNALLPGMPPEQVLTVISETSPDRVMVVGHEPDLSALIGHLLGTKGNTLELRKGGAAHLRIERSAQNNHATLLWHLKPKHLRMIGRESKT